MFKHFIWDFDGTLFNSYPATIEIFRSELLKYNIDESYEDVLKQFLISAGHAIDYFMKKYNLSEAFAAEFARKEEAMDLSLIKPYPYAVEVLSNIKENGGSNYLLTHRGETADKIIEINNMSSLFTELVTRENGFKRKPDPESVFYLMKKYDISRNEILIVGDREIEILLAQNSGTKVYFCNSGNITTKLNPDYEGSSLYDMCPLLGKGL